MHKCAISAGQDGRSGLLMLVSKAVAEGLLLAVIMCSWIAVILKVNPRYEMKSYPKEILAVIPAQTKREKRGFLVMALPVMLFVITGIVLCVYRDYAGLDISYAILFGHVFLILQIWNLLDWLVYDWIIFCTLNPGFMVIPGTEGNPGYQNYTYHFIGFLKGLPMTAAGAGILAGAVLMLRGMEDVRCF